ncbi:MAG: hypothetical protein QXI11_03305 [Thermoproteota archaeon]
MAYYKGTIKEILFSILKDDEKLTHSFHSKPIEDQRKIEAEIDRKSEQIAIDLVVKLREKGYLKNEPSEETIRKLIIEVLTHHGIEK